MSRPTPIVLVALLVCTGPLLGQRETGLRFRLLDGSDVPLYQQRRMDEPATAYVYAPFNLRLSEREEEKEITFLAYRPDSTAAITGGIMHFLLTWGPTPDQRRELESLLRMRTDSSSYLAGSLLLEGDPAAPGLEIGPPDHALARLLSRSLNSVASPPVNPGGKMAASFSFSATDARTVHEAIRHPNAWKDVYLRMRLRTLGHGYAPDPPATFTLTTSFARCIDSL